MTVMLKTRVLFQSGRKSVAVARLGGWYDPSLMFELDVWERGRGGRIKDEFSFLTWNSVQRETGEGGRGKRRRSHDASTHNQTNSPHSSAAYPRPVRPMQPSRDQGQLPHSPRSALLLGPTFSSFPNRRHVHKDVLRW